MAEVVQDKEYAQIWPTGRQSKILNKLPYSILHVRPIEKLPYPFISNQEA